MEELLQDMKMFIKLYKNATILNIIVVCICYMHMVFLLNIGIDTEVMVRNGYAWIGGWNGIGRYGLCLTLILLRGAQYNPYFLGVLFLASFCLLGISIAFLCWKASGRNNDYPYGLFMVLFSTCPAWMPQFYFALQRTEVVFGLIYAVISVFSLCQILYYKKRKVYWILAYLAFGVWSFCTYQGCVAFYIGLCIIFFLMDFINSWKEKQWKEYFIKISQLIGGFLIIFIFNTAITKLFFTQSDYLQNQILWGKLEISQIFHNIKEHIKLIIGCREMEFRSVYPFTCLCIAALFLGLCIKKEIRKSVKFILFIALAGLMITPFLLTFYIGGIPVARSQFVLQLISAFGCMFVYGVWKKEEKTVYQWMINGIMLVSVVAVWFSMSTIFRFQYTDDVRYQEDIRVASEIAEDIQKTKGTEGLPVIFVGGYASQLNGAARRADIYGASFLGWDYSAENPVGATGRITGFMHTLGINIAGTTEFHEEAVKAAKKMKCYPKKGYISVQDNFVVVKLSEIN